MSISLIAASLQILFRCQNQEELDWQSVWHLWVTGRVLTGFWWGNLRERDHLEDLGIFGEIILKIDL
jgi:hypothetical protein